MPVLVCSLHTVPGRQRLDRRWWGGVLERRAERLSSILAVDLLALTVSEHLVSVALVRRPDAAASWSDADVARRLAELRAARNLFAGAAAAGERRPAGDAVMCPPGAAEVVDAEAGRRILTCDVTYRRELLEWVALRRAAEVPRPETPDMVGRCLASDALDEPFLLAATALLSMEWAVLRGRWLRTRGEADHDGGAPCADAMVPRCQRLAAELASAGRTGREARPLMAAMRRSIGEDVFDHVQRLAVETLAGWQDRWNAERTVRSHAASAGRTARPPDNPPESPLGRDTRDRVGDQARDRRGGESESGANDRREAP